MAGGGLSSGDGDLDVVTTTALTPASCRALGVRYILQPPHNNRHISVENWFAAAGDCRRRDAAAFIVYSFIFLAAPLAQLGTTHQAIPGARANIRIYKHFFHFYLSALSADYERIKT